MTEPQELEPTNEFRWDIVKSSDSFVILASILAAFSFAALVILTTSMAIKGSKPEEVTFAIQVLLEAFFSLVVASFLFSVLAGEESAAGKYKPFAEGYVASWTLALSTVQLCASAVWLLSVYGVANEVLQTGRYIVYGAVVITSLSAIGVAVAPIFQHSLQIGRKAVLPWLVLSVLAIASGPVGWAAHHWGWAVLTPTFGSRLAVVSVAAVLLMALITAAFQSRRESTIQGYYAKPARYLFMLLSVLLLAALYTAYIATLPGLGAKLVGGIGL